MSDAGKDVPDWWRTGIIDMAPTILGIYGVGADGMDGRVLPVK